MRPSTRDGPTISLLKFAIIVAAVVSAAAVGCGAPSSGPTAGPATTVGKYSVDLALGSRIDEFFTTSYTGGFDEVLAVLVNVGGQPVVEKYKQSTPAATNDVFSVTKSVMSILVGIALDERRLTSLDQTVGELIPSYADRMAPGVTTITLRQLLTMTGGLSPTPPGRSSCGVRTGWARLSPRRRLRRRSPRSTPARVRICSRRYSPGHGRSVLDFAREKLFTPLGISTDTLPSRCCGGQHRRL